MVLYNEKDIQGIKKYHSDMGYNGFGNLTFTMAINPMLDSAGARGLIKSSSVALEKAISSSPEAINIIHGHAFGGQFLTGILNKVPVVNKLFPSKATQYDNKITRMLFGKDNVFSYQTNLDKQFASGQITNIDAASLKHRIEATGLSEADFLSSGFSVSNKKAIEAVKYMQTLELNNEDFKTVSTYFKNTADGKSVITANNYTKENLELMINKKAKQHLGSALDSSITVDDFVSKSKFGKDDVVKVLKQQRDYLSKSAYHGKEANKLFGNRINDATKLFNSTDDELVEYITTKNNKLANRLKKNVMTQLSKQLDDKADDIAKILTKTTRFEKVMSNPIMRFVTGSAGGLATPLNIAGAVIGGIAAHGQQKAVNNFTEIVLGRAYATQKTEPISNEAIQHSVQKHFENSQRIMEQYKSAYYFRNTSNELRQEISPLTIQGASINNFEIM